MPDFQIEKKVMERGFKSVAGLDEVGRGALFGPVVAAAVILPAAIIRGHLSGWIKEINDSKLISAAKRKRLAQTILENAESVGIGMAKNFEIDQKNIYWASLKAMRRAVRNLHIPPDFLLVDGFRLTDIENAQISIPQGDRKSISIAAASIVAKVLRDEMMIRLDDVYEGYALSKNKGYGTKEHFNALKKRGPSSFHRLSFNLGIK